MEGQFNARISRLERMQDSATEVPKPTSADAGKVVTVNQDGDGYVLGEGGGGGGGLPAYSASDIGKVLTVKTVHSHTPVEFFPRQSVTFANNGVGNLTGVALTPESISLGTLMILRVWPEPSQDDFNDVELTYTYIPQMDANFFTDQNNEIQVGYKDATWFMYITHEITSVPEMQANIYDVTGATVEWAEIPSGSDK